MTTSATIPATPAETIATGKRARAVELRRLGKTYRQIGRELAVHPATVQRWCASVALKTATDLAIPVTRLTRDDIQRAIFEHAPDALAKIFALSQGAHKEDVQLRASADLLDRAGFVPVLKSLNVSLVEEMSREELIAGIRTMLGSVQVQAGKDAPSADASGPAIAGANMGPDSLEPAASTQPAPANPPGPQCTQTAGGDVCTEGPDQGPALDTAAQKSNLHMQLELPLSAPPSGP